MNAHRLPVIAMALALLGGVMPAEAEDYSVAGLFQIENGGRMVWNFNSGWRFLPGDAEGAEKSGFDDSQWQVVTAPHTVQLMPAEASGCRNYQGVAWYRKHFVMPRETAGRDVSLHFEAIMGRQTIYVNGRKVKEHEGGYLPITVGLTELGCKAGDNVVIAVKADNSDDNSYPPGKKQMTLDFAYHGGMYRDVWMIAKQPVAITDAIEAGRVAGGGIFVHYEDVSAKSATVVIATELRNNDSRQRTVTVEQSLSEPVCYRDTELSYGDNSVTCRDKKLSYGDNFVTRRDNSVTHRDNSVTHRDNSVTHTVSRKITLKAGQTATVVQRIVVRQPRLWSPETPHLYNIYTRVREGRQTLDGGMTRAGIRSFEFVRTDDAQGRTPGFYLNGSRYHQLVGANRHQDFAYVGNALPNSQQWRDAKRLRDAGFTIIRTAHYPQDPSFMDACDEMGLFVIVATPGWQYWNKDAGWAEKVHENTRQIIRRDRNHPCVLMWEPILNETRYPEDFALEALKITREEYPYTGRPVAAADMHSAGVMQNYDVVYGWPGDDAKAKAAHDSGNAEEAAKWPRQPIFTREFGELVDDWYAHNNLNRASRSWGERPQMVQAMSLRQSARELYQTNGQFIGGCQWHPFDHQRGYHPDPYWGGIYDAFRQEKTAFWMFAALLTDGSEQPMVKIAHEMTQFSEADVTVFSNCDSVRLTTYGGEHCWTLPVTDGMAVFKGAWDFFEARQHSYTQKSWQSVTMLAEGICQGKVAASEEKMPSRRSTKLALRVADMGRQLVADGSDFTTVVCEVTDDLGHVRRLAKENICFTVSGEGSIIGDAAINANPRAVEWGSAPLLVRSTRKAGKIKIHAEVQFPGTHAPTAAELEIESGASAMQFCDASDSADGQASPAAAGQQASGQHQQQPAQLSEQEKARMLQEVEAQQADFGIQQ